MGTVATANYWEKHWEGEKPSIADGAHPLRDWLELNVPEVAGKSCFEFGCYPGKFLAVLGERGYSLSGIDSFPGSAKGLKSWLQEKGYTTETFIEADASHWKSNKHYDLVCSFGFIEHFDTWEEVVKNHVAMTKKGGKVIIEVPNLNAPLYYRLYKLFEPKTLNNHVLSVMDLDAIAACLEKYGCSVTTKEYIGHFHFRFVGKRTKAKMIIQRLINSLAFLIDRWPANQRSRYMAIIAVKP